MVKVLGFRIRIEVHLVIWRSVVTRTRSFSFSRLTKIPMKLMKANSTKARKTMEKQSITYLDTRGHVGMRQLYSAHVEGGDPAAGAGLAAAHEAEADGDDGEHGGGAQAGAGGGLLAQLRLDLDTE